MFLSDGAAGGVQGEECRAVLAWFGAEAAIKKEESPKWMNHERFGELSP